MTQYWESPLVPVLNLLVRLHRDLILLLDCPAKSAQDASSIWGQIYPRFIFARWDLLNGSRFIARFLKFRNWLNLGNRTLGYLGYLGVWQNLRIPPLGLSCWVLAPNQRVPCDSGSDPTCGRCHKTPNATGICWGNCHQYWEIGRLASQSRTEIRLLDLNWGSSRVFNPNTQLSQLSVRLHLWGLVKMCIIFGDKKGMEGLGRPTISNSCHEWTLHDFFGTVGGLPGGIWVLNRFCFWRKKEHSIEYPKAVGAKDPPIWASPAFRPIAPTEASATRTKARASISSIHFRWNL